MIVRYSLNADKNNAVGNKVRAALESASFKRIGTAAFEGSGSTEELMDAAHDALDLLRRPSSGARVDHLWIYFDRADGQPDSN